MKELEYNTIESSEMVEQTFHFWFNDNNHIRSPFPKYIQSRLKDQSTEEFFKWVKDLDPKAKDELNDEAVGEKFEEIIFETAIGLINNEDERTTLLYPFLPRIGDKLEESTDENNSIIIERELVKEGDNSFLQLTLENNKSKEKWKTQVELPI